MADIKSYIKESRDKEIKESLVNLLDELKSEDYSVEFGHIGVRTTYALIFKHENHEEEYVGYTYIRNPEYNNPVLGQLKALQQAVARKNLRKM